MASLATEGYGRIALTNAGYVRGKIDCDASLGLVDDVITNRGTISGAVLLGGGNDRFIGVGGRSGKVSGELGNDTLVGGAFNDSLDGGAGLDLLRGNRGKDVLTGGAERDTFDFNALADSNVGSARDQIRDFQRGLDVIDLGGMDSDTTASGNQAFKFIGTGAFSGIAGQLRCGSGVVQGDVNGDGRADFEIKVNVGVLAKGDFIL
jgi:Ca2+-binding RTX toxin-like protein